MPTVKNTTDEEICVRTGKSNADYIFYFVPAKGTIKVSRREAKKISKRIRETKTVGITVSGLLTKAIKKEKPKELGEEVSVEVN